MVECNVKECWCLTPFKTSVDCVGVQRCIPDFALKALKQHTFRSGTMISIIRDSNQTSVRH
jgi:hypothetical protein